MNILRTSESLPSEVVEAKIKVLEQAINTVLPASLKALLMQYNVCKPHRNHYKNKKTEFTINKFLGFSANRYDDISTTYDTFIGRMPEELLPIASVDGGDLLCMNKETGYVYYWFHEEDDWGLEGNQKYPTLVSSDLNEFIEKLTFAPLPTQEEIARVMAHGKVTLTPKGVELRNAMRPKEGLPPLSMEEWHKLLNNRTTE